MIYCLEVLSSRHEFWILVFDIHLTFGFCHLALTIKYFLMTTHF
jgi:hypothetical protein